ncbi:hypothetical protein ACS0TY_004487 [Phlomoides rotata]
MEVPGKIGGVQQLYESVVAVRTDDGLFRRDDDDSGALVTPIRRRRRRRSHGR